jgi:hypothetical protein
MKFRFSLGWGYSAVLGFIMGVIFSSLFRGGDFWREVGGALLMGLLYGFAAFIVGLLSFSIFVDTVMRGGGNES